MASIIVPPSAGFFQHNYLILGKEFSVGDKVLSFGFSQDNYNGDIFTAEIEGFSKAEDYLIKFKGGQVKKGFSGAPLLNQNSGFICGVVNETRNQSFDLGGYAIPTQLIFDKFPKIFQIQKKNINNFLSITSKSPSQTTNYNYYKKVIKLFSSYRGYGNNSLSLEDIYIEPILRYTSTL
ncbi:MAG: hypothetical protein IPG79_14350 [Saprospiraceae bacterium]|nr:hypothetical protein [Saprospiraceae bacterium]